MKFCPVVPEICRGQVHVPKKERRIKRIIIIIIIIIIIRNRAKTKGGQSHVLRGSKGVGVTIESYGKVEISFINVDNF
jgi:hypothetical protein